MSAEDRHVVPRGARLFVATLLLAMAVCAIATLELWPLTGWQLFSHLRSEEQRGWTTTAVYDDGTEVPYALGDAERGFRGFQFIISDFAELGDAERDGYCVTWVEGTGDLLPRPAEAVNIYELVWRLSERLGERAAPAERELVYRCSAEGLESREAESVG